MDVGFALGLALALGFALTNGLHDASNSIALLVATRAARPLQAVALAAAFNLLGPLLLGAAVADTVGGIVVVDGSTGVAVIAAALLAAVAWNLATWARGLPASSGHALVGGLIGAGAVAGGAGIIQWRTLGSVLVADGRATELSSPAWAAVACAGALTLGTALGGWRIVRTIGRGIVRLHPLDGVAGQGASGGLIVAASALGAPVSTTQVVASAVVGVAGGRRRWRHVRWAVVREIALGWTVTLPVTAVLAAGTLLLWQALG